MSIAEPTAAALPAMASVDALSLRSRRGRVMLGTLTAAHFAHHTSNSLLNPLLPLIRDTFALSYAQAGFAVSAFGLSVGLANGPMGILADRIGSRRVIVAGLVIGAATSVALGLTADYAQLLVMLLALGLVSGTYHGPAAAIIARVFSSRVRGAAMGFHITGGHLSFFAAPLVAAWLATLTGTWRTAYVGFAIIPVLCAIALWRIAPDDRPSRHVGDLLAPFREIRNVLGVIGPLVSLSLVFQIGLASVNAFLALYLVDARGVSPVVAAAAFGFTQLAGVVGAPLGGTLSDRLGRKTLIVASLGAVGPLVWLLTLVPNELVLVPLGLIGIAVSTRSVATEVLVMDSAAPERRASVLGAYYLASQPIGGIAAPFFGLAAGAFGIAATFSGVAIGLVGLSAFTVILGRRL